MNFGAVNNGLVLINVETLDLLISFSNLYADVRLKQSGNSAVKLDKYKIKVTVIDKQVNTSPLYFVRTKQQYMNK